MKKIKVRIIGMGFIGVSHIEAVSRIGSVELAAVTDGNLDLAEKKANEYGIPKCHKTVEELLSDKKITAVHNCTPTTCTQASTKLS